MSSAVLADVETPFNPQINKDSLGKPSDMSVGGALIWKDGVVINIRIYLICKQIYQMSAATKLAVSRSESQ